MSKVPKNVPSIVVIVPCFNESESLEKLVETLDTQKSLLQKSCNLEYLLVNDGSSDNTQETIESISKKNANVFYREFAHNVGHQSALRAGLSVSTKYDAAIMMDADLQHPPELIKDMVQSWMSGNKIVQMIRDDSDADSSMIRHAMSILYYRVINLLSDLKLEYGASDFRLIDKTVIKTVAASKEQDLFLRGYFSWLKVQRQTIQYRPNKRFAGSSKYSLNKLLKLAFQGILQFSEKPLRIAINIGVIVAAASFLYGVLLIIMYLLGDQQVSGWTSLMVIVLFCFGINFIITGIVGTYLAHLIRIVKQRPEYIIASEKLPK